jgi:hypothetical protein
MTAHLTPMKQSALHAMTKGELRFTPDGWVSTVGIEGIWNSHAILWLAGKGYCVIRGSRAAITADGRDAVDYAGMAA